MRRRRNSSLPVLVAVIVLISCALMACSDGTGEKETVSGEKNSTTSDYEKAEDFAGDPKTTPYGRYPETVTYTLAKMTAENNSNLPEGDTYEDNAYTRLILEVINAQNKDVFENSGDAYTAGISTMVATGKLSDVMVVDQKTMYDMQERGMLADLTEAYENCASSRIKEIYKSYGEDIFQSCTFDGKLMALPETNISDGPNLVWVRKDWLDQLGLQEPETIADVEEIAAAFAKENPGNAAGGNIGLACSTELFGGTGVASEYGMDLVFASYDAYPGRWLLSEDGTISYGSVSPKVRDALSHLAEMYQEGILDPDFLIRTSDDIADLVVNGSCGIFFGPWWAPNNPLWKCHEVDWQPYLIATGEDGSVSYCHQKMTGNYVVVRKDYEHPEVVMKILSVMFDYMRYTYDDPNGEFERYYRENVDPTARPLAINVDYNQALEICYENLSGALSGEKPWEELELLERSYYRVCKKYLEDPQDATAESWSGYQSRITACALLQNANLSQISVFYPMTTGAMEEYWYDLEELETETFLKIIRGEEDITAFDDFVEKWYDGGGREILREVQEQREKQ
ncbi:MAG: extracellular solute-binding protein [Fusicatenibacter sp.]|nr:extracellular solute-binding protein [Fusicatenibacter sp.]